MTTVQLTNTHLNIVGQKIEIKNDRFYANSQLFDSIMMEYKQDTDFWNKENYFNGQKVEIVIEKNDNETVQLRAYNLRSGLIWISSDIEENHFEKAFFKFTCYFFAFIVLVLTYLRFA